MKLLLAFIALSTAIHAKSQIDFIKLELLKEEAVYQSCKKIVEYKKTDKEIEKVILTAGLLTDSRAILDMIQLGEGELSYFIQCAISFCKIISAYSFKEITDRLL